MLAYPMKNQQFIELQEKVISTCVDHISRQQHLALEGSKNRWHTSSSALKKRDLIVLKKIKRVLPRVEGYVDCMRKCGVHWMGLKFKFPLIWWPTRPYRDDFSLSKAEENQC